jgi:hypothetical protein
MSDPALNVLRPQGALGELANRLEADVSGEIRREYCEMFAAARDTARRRLQEPQSAEEFDMNAALMESAQLCDEVISAVWHALHP